MRGALTARGTRREPVTGDSMAASMPPHGPPIGKDPAPDSWSAANPKRSQHMSCGLATTALLQENKESNRSVRLAKRFMHCFHLHTDHSDWSLRAHRRGT
ncbi:hypothetical protein XpiCFBP4643_13955 [Xanthomonas pisi]|uniref:Uncharacterized protein n=1 Tax=Xanthomonas pisi TaxID=56457 RepID=A0A2S7D1D1_9XANT|nr:hypothetical protein XpiCFBP4643_13955 [Xanthomonas pisi]